MNKRNNLAEIYLNRNVGDPIFENAKEIDENCDKALQKEVNKIYWNTHNDFKRLLGIMSKYYDKGFTLSDYYTNILSTIGRGDIEKGGEMFDSILNDVAKDITERITVYADVEVKAVKHIIIVQTLYKPYLGFLFEEYIRELLENEGIFNIEYSEELDNKYKIDLLIYPKAQQYSDYAVGLQLKSYTFEKTFRKYKEKYWIGNVNAIERGLCKDVRYLLHNDNAELLKGIRILQNNEQICNSESVRMFAEEFTVADEREFIDELLKIIQQCYNKEHNNNKENGTMIEFFESFSRYKREKDFEKFKESIYKTEKGLPSTPIDK